MKFFSVTLGNNSFTIKMEGLPMYHGGILGHKEDR